MRAVNSKANRRMRRGLPWACLLVALLCGGTLALASSHIEREEAGYSGPAAAQCVPEHLNASAQLPGTPLEASPMPGSHDAATQTQISLLGAPARELQDIHVSGTFSGAHGGRLRPYSQGDGASFVPDRPFDPGETVRVRGRVEQRGRSQPFFYRFTIAYRDPIPERPPGSAPVATAHEYQSFHSAPALHPPTVDVTDSVPTQDAPGDIFAAPYSGPGNAGPMIFEPNGQLVWMDPLPENVFATNFQLESLHGEPVLTWWQGYIPPNGFGMGEEIVANASYQTIMRIHAGNGYLVDLHDFHLEPNDTALFTVFDPIHCDLSSVRGPRDGDVTDGIFQEVDLATGLVRREWHSVDHVPLSASYASPEKASALEPYDYFHINSLDRREDGTTLISARNTWGLYLIDDRTGQVRATLGGKQPSVKMGPGTMTAYQHDAMTLPNGEISIFDNGGTPFQHPQSRGLVIALDLGAGTDTKVAELVHPRPLQAGSQGNVQLLPNGNWFIGWGAEPYFTELTPAGQMIYDAHLALEPIKTEHGEHIASYRAYKFPWRGTPTQPPAIAAEPSHTGLTVYASWNGATEVAAWQVLGGDSPQSLAPVGRASRSGFETAIGVPAAQYVAVQALDSAGAVIGHSATIKG